MEIELVMPVVVAKPMAGAHVHVLHVQHLSSPNIIFTGSVVRPGYKQALKVSMVADGAGPDAGTGRLFTTNVGSGKALSMPSTPFSGLPGRVTRKVYA